MPEGTSADPEKGLLDKGIADDLAVLGLALNLCKPELAAFKEFRDGSKLAG